MVRKIKNYEVKVKNEKVVNITKTTSTGIVPANAYKYNYALKAWEKLEEVTFGQLKNGIYKDTIQIF